MNHIRTLLAILFMTGCSFPRPDNIEAVKGNVRGLWDGSDGLALRLQSDEADALLTVKADGPFAFAPLLTSGMSYSVSIISSPNRHSCSIQAGGNGVVLNDTNIDINITCSGPDARLDISSPWGWTFDSGSSVQRFSGSIAQHSVSFTLAGRDGTGASVEGQLLDADNSVSIALPLGPSTATATIHANDLSRTYQLEFDRGQQILEQVAYGKASNTGYLDLFGTEIAISGNTLAVTAVGEDSNAIGANGNEGDNSAEGRGAVYVFRRRNTSWSQEAYLKPSNNSHQSFGMLFGASIAIDRDTIAIGATGESSNASGINGNQANSSLGSSGAVYVFVRTGTSWTQQAYIKASNNVAERSSFGMSVALQGNLLAVGAPGEAGLSAGINGDQHVDPAIAGDSGAVYIFERNDIGWVQTTYIKASHPSKGDGFGYPVALSENLLAVGATREDSNATGVDGDQENESLTDAGAVYVFALANGVWRQQAYVKASNPSSGDRFGASISLNNSALAVGAPDEDSGAVGIDGNGGDDVDFGGSGAAYLFRLSGATWRQEAYIKASTAQAGQHFGNSVAVVADLLAVGAPGNSSRGTGVLEHADMPDPLFSRSGAAYLFRRSSGVWFQALFIKGSNTGRADEFGNALAISADTIAVTAHYEESASTGINANGQTDNSTLSAGAVYVFR